MDQSHHIMSNVQLIENKGGPTHGFKKQRIYSAQWKYELPGLGKDASG